MASGERDSNHLAAFDCKADPPTLAYRWKRWRRAFELYLVAKNVTDNARKQALLLHMGGMDLQEIFDAIAGDVTDYQTTMDKLEEHFKPQKHVTHERHVFRKLSQAAGETIDQYCVRIRVKSAGCDFGDLTDSFIKDQIIEGCASRELKLKFLEKPDQTLKQVLETARAWECASSYLSTQEEKTEATGSVNKVRDVKQFRGRGRSRKGGSHQEHSSRKQEVCYRCGYSGHFARDMNCPARGKQCEKCKIEGHFAKMCKTKSTNMGRYAYYVYFL